MGYLTLNLLYSKVLKRLAFIDVLAIAPMLRLTLPVYNLK